MEQFFRSVGRSFGENRELAGPVAVAALALFALVVALQIAAWLRSRRSRRSALQGFAAHRGMSEADLEGAIELARQASVEPLVLLTHLDLFEGATAKALAGQDGWPRESPLASRIRRIREAVGFDRLPVHYPLLTTRELAPGTALEVAALPGQISYVDEASFAVEARGKLELAPGQKVPLALVHAREARYSLRCQLLAALPIAEDRWRLVFAHDEAPARLQLREYARVAVQGPVALRPATRSIFRKPEEEDVAGELVDASAGGLLAACPRPLPAGHLMLASFALAGTTFEEIRTVVLSSASSPAGPFHVRLEFRGLDEAGRERLVAAVARVSNPRAAPGA